MALVIANIHFPIGDVSQVLCCKQTSERGWEKGKKEREEERRRKKKKKKKKKGRADSEDTV